MNKFKKIFFLLFILYLFYPQCIAKKKVNTQQTNNLETSTNILCLRSLLKKHPECQLRCKMEGSSGCMSAHIECLMERVHSQPCEEEHLSSSLITCLNNLLQMDPIKCSGYVSKDKGSNKWMWKYKRCLDSMNKKKVCQEEAKPFQQCLREKARTEICQN